MTRQIDLSKRLSSEDREYLVQRGRTQDIENNEAQFGKSSGMSSSQRDDRIAELQSELAKLIAERDFEQNPNVENPVVGVGGGLIDRTHVEGVPPVVVAAQPVPVLDDYDTDQKKWTATALRSEINERNEQRKGDGLPALSNSGNRAEMIKLLRQDDSEIAAAQAEENAK